MSNVNWTVLVGTGALEAVGCQRLLGGRAAACSAL